MIVILMKTGQLEECHTAINISGHLQAQVLSITSNWSISCSVYTRIFSVKYINS